MMSYLILKNCDQTYALRYWYCSYNRPISDLLEQENEFTELNHLAAVEWFFGLNQDLYDFVLESKDDFKDNLTDDICVLKNWPARFNQKDTLGLYKTPTTANNLSWANVFSKIGDQQFTHDDGVFVYDHNKWNIVVDMKSGLYLPLKQYIALKNVITLYKDEPDSNPEDVCDDICDKNIFGDTSDAHQDVVDTLLWYLSLETPVQKLLCSDSVTNTDFEQKIRMFPEIDAVLTKSTLLNTVRQSDTMKKSKL